MHDYNNEPKSREEIAEDLLNEYKAKKGNKSTQDSEPKIGNKSTQDSEPKSREEIAEDLLNEYKAKRGITEVDSTSGANQQSNNRFGVLNTPLNLIPEDYSNAPLRIIPGTNYNVAEFNQAAEKAELSSGTKSPTNPVISEDPFKRAQESTSYTQNSVYFYNEAQKVGGYTEQTNQAYSNNIVYGKLPVESSTYKERAKKLEEEFSTRVSEIYSSITDETARNEALYKANLEYEIQLLQLKKSTLTSSEVTGQPTKMIDAKSKPGPILGGDTTYIKTNEQRQQEQTEEAYQQATNPYYSQVKEIDGVITKKSAELEKLNFQENYASALQDPILSKALEDMYEHKNEQDVVTTYGQPLIKRGYDAWEMFELYKSQKKSEEIQNKLESVEQFADEHPILGTGLSASTKLLSTVGVLEPIRAAIMFDEVDPNSPLFTFNKITSALRSGASDDMSDASKFMYNIVTSIGDATVNAAASGGNLLVYKALNAAQAASDSAHEDAQKGYSTAHIFINAALSAATSVIIDKLGYDEWSKNLLSGEGKQLFRTLIASFVGEGLEEGTESAANIAAENITSYIFTHETEVKKRVTELTDGGMSTKDAILKAIGEIGAEIGTDAIAGGFAGSIISTKQNIPGFIGSIVNKALTEENSDIQPPTTDVDNALNSAPEAEVETKPKTAPTTPENVDKTANSGNTEQNPEAEATSADTDDVRTTVDENGVEWLDFDDDTDFEAVNEELKEEYNAEETAGLAEKVEPYTSGNSAVDALINPNGRLDRKITIGEQAQQRIIDTAQKMFGRKVRFENDIPNADGFFDPDTGEIVLSKTSSMKELTLFGHEFSHTLEGTNEYRYLTTHLRHNSQYIKSQLAKVNNSWDELVQQKINDYQDSLGKTLTKPQAEFEIYADAIANELFTDYKAIEVLATQNQSLFTRLKQWFYRNVIKTIEQTTVLGTKAAQRKTYALMLKAEKAAMNKASGEGVVTPTETVAFEPTQIKSATDNIGTFDKNNPDIRYSAKPSETAQRITENFGYTETTANNIVKAARSLKQKADSKADTNELAYTIAQTLEDRRNGNTDGRDAERIAMMIAENAKAVNEDFVAEYKPILDRLNGMKISISEADISDLGDAFSYVKKRLFPYVTLTKGEGTRVDSIFQDLAKDYPMVFNAEAVTHPGDQVKAIMGFIEDYRNNRYFKPYFESDEAFANLREDVETLLGDKTLDENTYLNKLSQLVDKYGEIKNGVPQSTDGKTRVRGAIASFYGTKPIVSNPELSERYAKDIVNGKYDYDVMRIGKEAKQYLDNIKSSENVTEKVINEYGRLKDLLTDKDHRLTPTDIMQACALNPLLGEVLTDDAYVDYTSIVAEIGTEAGQILNSFKLISQFSGTQKLKAIQKKVDRINQKEFRQSQEDIETNAVVDENGQFKTADESLGKDNKKPKGVYEFIIDKKKAKYPPIEIPADLQEKLRKAKGQKAIEKASKDIEKYVMQQMHASWFDKLNAWRYLAMLSNPKTAIRNTVGNVAMMGASRIKDVVAAGVSKLPVARKYKDSSVQTSAVITTKEARNAAKRLMIEDGTITRLFSNQDKYTGRLSEFKEEKMPLNKVEQKLADKSPMLGLILNNRTVRETPLTEINIPFTQKKIPFVGEALGWASQNNQRMLDDTPYKIIRAKSVLSQSITAALNSGEIANVDDFVAVVLHQNTDHLDNATKDKYTRLYDKFCQQAAKEGDESTFRDDNALADKINKLRQGNRIQDKIGTVLVDGFIPFVKTPANIVKRGIEYSPIGLGKAAFVDRYKLAKGDIDRNAYINNLAKGLTGTSIFALGALLSSLGVLSVGDDDEEDEAERKLLNGQKYAIDFGDSSYSIEFLTPAALPLFMGGKVYETIANMTEGDEVKAGELIFDILQGIAEPMFAQTMLSGVDGAFEAVSRETRFNDEEGASAIAVLNYCTENWINQFIPSVFGAVARTADDTVRGYFTEKGKEEGLLDTLMVGIKKKLPGKTDETPAKLDMWGQPMSSGTLGERFIENFISPGYYEENTDDEATLALYEFADDNDIPYTDIIPKDIPKFYNFRGETYNLTAEEYELYAGIIGKARKEAVEKALVDGEDIEVSYRLYDIKSANDSGITFKDVVFEGNLADAENIKGWAPSGESEGYFEYEYSDEDNKKKATSKTPVSDEEFRKFLFDEYMKQVTEEAAFEARKQIAENRE